jgi:hypothetical protein
MTLTALADQVVVVVACYPMVSVGARSCASVWLCSVCIRGSGRQGHVGVLLLGVGSSRLVVAVCGCCLANLTRRSCCSTRLAAHLHSEVTRIQDVVEPVVAFLVLHEVVS